MPNFNECFKDLLEGVECRLEGVLMRVILGRTFPDYPLPQEEGKGVKGQGPSDEVSGLGER